MIGIDTEKLNVNDAHYLIGYLESAIRRGDTGQRQMAVQMLDGLRKQHPELACSTCVKYEGKMHPRHYASRNCESGGRSHCTCDACF